MVNSCEHGVAGINDRIRSVLLIAIFGALVLPPFDIWSGLIRIAAFMFIWNKGAVRWKGFFIALSIVIAILWVISTLNGWSELLRSPVSYVYNSVRSVYGIQEHWQYGVLLLVVDAWLVVMLARAIWLEIGKTSSPMLAPAILYAMLLFWLLPQLGLIDEILDLLEYFEGAFSEEEVYALISSIERQLSAIAVWNIWIIASFLAIGLFLQPFDRATLFSVILMAGFFQSLIVGVQHLLGDYSYVLESPDFSQYFYRVKGSYGYHAAASQFLVLAYFVGLFQRNKSRFDWRWWIVMVSIALTAYLNSTRAISLAMLMGSVAYIIMTIDLRGMASRRLMVSVIAVVFAGSIFYQKTEYAGVESTVEGESIEALAQTNKARIELLRSGLEEILSSPVLGSGVGAAKLPLSGHHFGGELHTYSSHALLPDIAIMAGIPAAILLVFIFGATGMNALVGVFKYKDNPELRNQFSAYVAYLIAFGVTTVFVPQERNWLILLVFLIMAMHVVSYPERYKKSVD